MDKIQKRVRNARGSQSSTVAQEDALIKAGSRVIQGRQTSVIKQLSSQSAHETWTCTFCKLLGITFYSTQKYYCLENLFTFSGTLEQGTVFQNTLAIANKLSCIDKTKNFSVTATSLNITPLVFVWINSNRKEKKNPRQGLNCASLDQQPQTLTAIHIGDL